MKGFVDNVLAECFSFGTCLRRGYLTIGKMFLKSWPRWSATDIDKLCCTIKFETITSAFKTFCCLEEFSPVNDGEVDFVSSEKNVLEDVKVCYSDLLHLQETDVYNLNLYHMGYNEI